MSTQDPVEAFRSEAGELLDGTEQALLDLSHDLGSRDLIDTVFRGMHTLKGSGAMFGFDALAGFTHHCETAFDLIRKGLVPATAELVAATRGLARLIAGSSPPRQATGTPSILMPCSRLPS